MKDLVQSLVTGASSGIGLQVARRLRSLGHEVFGVSRRQVPRQQIPGRAEVTEPQPIVSVPMDLAQLDQLPGQLAALTKRLEHLEFVVLAAGAGHFGSLEQSSYEQLRRVIDLNVTANLYLCRALMPSLKRRGTGKIVFIGSEAGLRGKRQGAVYCASKFAVRGLAQALRDECSSSGVGVSVIQPGMVRTPFFEDLDFEPGPERDHALVAAEVADAVQYVIQAPASSVIDEIELSPLKRVVKKKSNGAKQK